jgi:hypothetical protein
MFPTILTKASYQSWKEVIATNHLSVLLRLAPKLETIDLGWTSRAHPSSQKEVDKHDLRRLKSECEKRKRSS